MAVSTTKSVNAKAKETIKDDIFPNDVFGEERVSVYIIPDGKEEYIEGCLNGHNWRIPTDKQVTIPTSINEIIMQSRRVIRESKAAMTDFEKGTLDLTK